MFYISLMRAMAQAARDRRWLKFCATFPNFADMKVVDLGGTVDFWTRVPVPPAHVTVVNLQRQEGRCAASWLTSIEADACAPVQGAFDLVFSNSLIEHVGGHWRRERLAENVHALAPSHWIQTPYRYFPVEPHWRAVGMQWLPDATRVAIAERWRHGHYRPDGPRESAQVALEVELLSLTTMRYHFPESRIWIEKWVGLPKSIVAIR